MLRLRDGDSREGWSWDGVESRVFNGRGQLLLVAGGGRCQGSVDV